MLSDSRLFLLLRKVTSRGNAMLHFIKIRHIYVFPIGHLFTTHCSRACSTHKKRTIVPIESGRWFFYITSSSKVDLMYFTRLLGFTMLFFAMTFTMCWFRSSFFSATINIMLVVGIAQVFVRISIPQKGGNKPNEQQCRN